MELRFNEYTVDLPRPITTAHGVYRTRAGVLIALRDDDGAVGYGDAAPLAPFSKESVADVVKTLRQAGLHGTETLRAITSAENRQTDDSAEACLSDLSDDLPSVRFALDVALIDLASRKQGLPMACCLAHDPAPHVDVNGLVDGLDSRKIERHIRDSSQRGFRTFKIKVDHDADAAIERVLAARDAAPDAALRVDVNAAWTPAQLRYALPQLAKLDLEFLEQPLPPGSARDAAGLCRAHGVRLALDEEITECDDAIRLCEDRLCDVIVLKPMIIGGMMRSLRLIDRAAGTGMQVVVTSTWESDIGVAAAMHLSAAGWPATIAAGLSTAGTIGARLVDRPLLIREGRLKIGNRPGLGVEVVEGFFESGSE